MNLQHNHGKLREMKIDIMKFLNKLPQNLHNLTAAGMNFFVILKCDFIAFLRDTISVLFGALYFPLLEYV